MPNRGPEEILISRVLSAEHSAKGKVVDNLEKIGRNFAYIDQYSDTFKSSRQVVLENNFKNSCRLIQVIGDLEQSIGSTDRPIYQEQRKRWNERKIKATRRGYTIKSFDHYASQEK